MTRCCFHSSKTGWKIGPIVSPPFTTEPIFQLLYPPDKTPISTRSPLRVGAAELGQAKKMART